MPLEIIRNDIVKMTVDAIVNATDSTFSASGGVDRLIHNAAGPALMEECRNLGQLKSGTAVVTGGYGLSCKYVIHTAGPVWQGGSEKEEKLLSSCYQTVLHKAADLDCTSIAVPLISTGSFGCPKEVSLRIAVSEISRFLLEHEMQVFLVLFDKDSFMAGSRLFKDISSFIDDTYVEENEVYESVRYYDAAVLAESRAACCSLNDALKMLDESFSETLLRLIKEKGISEVECYKKANIDRKLFSKIRSDRDYRPSKQTVLAFAISLELPPEEIDALLRTAGYALSHSNKADIIVEYFISQGNYNIHEINAALFAFDQSLIGGVRD